TSVEDSRYRFHGFGIRKLKARPSSVRLSSPKKFVRTSGRSTVKKAWLCSVFHLPKALLKRPPLSCSDFGRARVGTNPPSTPGDSSGGKDRKMSNRAYGSTTDCRAISASLRSKPLRPPPEWSTDVAPI